MTVKNFKISTGLDIDGIVLNVGTANSLVWNGNTLATQTYVNDAISGVTVDPSGWAGTWLDWNSGTNQFDVNIPSGTYAAPADIPSLSGYATESYVNSQGFITSSALSGYATETYVNNLLNDGTPTTTTTYSSWTIENKLGDYTKTTDLVSTLTSDGFLQTVNGSVSVPGTGAFTVSATSDIVLSPAAGSKVYIGSASTNNEVVTIGNVPAGYTDTDAIGAISNALGNGLSFSGGQFVVDTSVIATQSYLTTALGDYTKTVDLPTQYITSVGTMSPFTVSSGELGINLGDGLRMNYGTNSIEVAAGITNTIPYNGLILDSGKIAISTVSGNGLTFDTFGNVEVDTSVIATKEYVDATAQGLDVKEAVIVATTENITLSGYQWIDGRNPVSSMRVLVKDQTNPAENGIYHPSEGTWTRVADADTLGYGSTPGNLRSGTFVFVQDGDTNKGKGFVALLNIMTYPNIEVNWSQFSETGNYITSVSNDFNVESNTLSVKAAGNIVTKTGTQTLTNKTLANPIITAGETVLGVGNAQAIILTTFTDGFITGWTTGNGTGATTLTISGSASSDGDYQLSSPLGSDGSFTLSETAPMEWNNGFPVGSIVTAKTVGTISSTEISYLDGVTSNIQTQLNTKYDSTSLPTIASGLMGTGGGGLEASIYGTISLATPDSSSGLSLDSQGRYSVDFSQVASSTALSYKQDAFTLGTGLTNPTASSIGVDFTSVQAKLTAGHGVKIENVTGTDNTIHIDVSALAGTGITYDSGTDTLTAAPAYISSVDSSFTVGDGTNGTTLGQLSLSDTISVASVEIADAVNSVTASSDVFGKGSITGYAMGSNQTVGALPTGSEVADVFITLKYDDGTDVKSRTSKITAVFTGNEAPTWTEYGIITSGWTYATTISFDSSKNIIVNVTGTSNYSAKGVYTIVK